MQDNTIDRVWFVTYTHKYTGKHEHMFTSAQYATLEAMRIAHNHAITEAVVIREYKPSSTAQELISTAYITVEKE